MFSRIRSSAKIFVLLLIAVLTVSAKADTSTPPGLDSSLLPLLQSPPTFTKSFSPNTIGPGSVSTITFTITNGSASPVTGLAFTDTLPAAITIADPANASTTCDLGSSGILSAPDGGSTITLSDAQIGGSQSCTVTVDVTASTPGAHTNPAITLNSSTGSTMSSPVDLTVATDRPGFSKSFAPSSIPKGNRSTLTFTIDNIVNSSDALLLAFTDNLPSGLVVADPANVSDTCNAFFPSVVTADPGSSLISYSNGSVAAGAVCTISVEVIATSTGMLDNVTGELTSRAGPTTFSSGKAGATLESTITPLALEKSFTDDPVPPSGTATLEFKITNFDRNFSATDLAFTDDLTALVPPLAGLTISSLLSNDCGGSVSGVGGMTLGFSGGSLSAEGSCTIRVSLSVPGGAATGSYANTTSAVTGTVDGSPAVGNVASDKLFVDPAPVFTKEFIDDPATGGGTVTLRFTIQNIDPTSSLTSIEFTDDIGGTGDGRTGALPGLAANSLVAAGGLDPEPLVDPCGAGSELTISDPNDSLPSPPFPNLPPDPTLLVFTGGNLAQAGMAGDSCTFDIVLDIPDGIPTNSYVNTTSDLTASPTGTSAASDSLIIVAAPPLRKEFTGDPVAPGGIVTLQFTLEHSAEAPADAIDISFTDDLNAMGLASLTLNLPPSPDPPCGAGSSLTAPGNVLTLQDGSLMPGESCTFSVTLNIPALAAPNNYTNNTSNVSATVGGLAVTSAAASDDLKVAGLVFTKAFLDDPVIAGDTTTLRFTIENIHPTDDTTGISFSDNLAAVLPGTPDLTATLPPATDTCGGVMSGPTNLSYSGGSVTSGSTCIIEVEVLVPAGTADGSYNNDTSNLNANQGGAVVIDPAADELVVDSTRLQLTKSFTDDPVAPGDSVTLEFILTNLDAGQAASSIGFTDDLGAALTGLTFDSVLVNTCGGTVGGTGTTTITVSGVSLAASASCTLSVSLTVPGGAAANTYTNSTSDVSGTMGGLAVRGDTASDNLEVIQLLLFSKSFDGPTTATGNATLSFTITNPGTNTATGLAFSDDLSAVISGLTATNLPATPCGVGSSISGSSFLTFTAGEAAPMGGTCSFDVDVLVPVTATAGTFPNTTSDLFQSGLQVADPATADLTIEPPPTFGKVFMPDAIAAGGVSTLTFTIDNSASALAASDLDFTDNLPAGVVIANPTNASTTCTGGTLTAAPGTSIVTYTGGSVGAGASCTVSVDMTSSTAGVYVNTTGNLTSSSGNSGTATDTLTVGPAADISVTKSNGVSEVTPGGSVTYTIAVSNAGPSADPTVSLTDDFPNTLLNCTSTSVAAGGATGNTAAGSGNLAETLSMPAGSSVTYTVGCTIALTASDTLSNTAIISGSVTDPTPGNNSATDSDTVLDTSVDLAISKNGVRDNEELNGVITYTLMVVNNGPAAAPSATISDPIPTGVTDFSWSCTASGGVTCPNANGTGPINESGGIFPANAQLTYTVRATLAISTATITNTATVTNPTGPSDSDLGNNSTTHVSRPASTIYLPLVLKNPVFLPDLVIDNFVVNSNQATITIRNAGLAPIPVDNEFWVQIVFDTAPTGVNQRWDTLSDQGALWGVVSPAVPLAPNATLTLTLNDPYFYDGNPPGGPVNNIPNPIPVGTTIYAQVDAIDFSTTYGAVLEGNENNNIVSTVSIAGASTVRPADSNSTNSSTFVGLPEIER